MTQTNQKTVLRIFILVLPLLVLLVPVVTEAQTYTPEETSCFNMVQGKVAWNTAGNTTWNETNIRNLCRGTTNASATVSCFRSKISSGLAWDKAMAACTPAALASAPRRNTAALLQEQEQRIEVAALPAEPGVKTNIAFRNYGGNPARLRVFRADRPLDTEPVAESRSISGGDAIDIPFSADIPTDQLEVEVRMVVVGGYVPIYRAKITSGGNNFCFEATGTAYIPSAKPCQNTQAVEAKRISFKNEAGYAAKMSLDYVVKDAVYDSQSIKTITTDDTILGMSRVLYIPRDAVLDREMTLKVNGLATHKALLLSTTLDGRRVTDSTCYKVWGSQVTPKVSPCSISSSARTIKLMNYGAFNTSMEVTYFDRTSQGDVAKSVRTNVIELLHNESIEVPASSSTRPVEVKFYVGDGTSRVITTYQASSSFSGELCYRTEGTLINPVVSACDNSVGDASTGDVRQIRFQNDAAYDAEMTVMYFANELVNGVSIPTPKTVNSGFINGLGGKFRVLNIPKDTSPNLPITIYLVGNATVKDGIFSTTLPANFAGSPQPCFKVWGTLFNPGGGTCNQ